MITVKEKAIHVSSTTVGIEYRVRIQKKVIMLTASDITNR